VGSFPTRAYVDGDALAVTDVLNAAERAAGAEGAFTAGEIRGLAGMVLRDGESDSLDTVTRLHATLAPDAGSHAGFGVGSQDVAAAHLFARAGAVTVRFGLQMTASTAGVPVVDVPDGVRLAAYTDDLARALHAAHTEAFAVTGDTTHGDSRARCCRQRYGRPPGPERARRRWAWTRTARPAPVRVYARLGFRIAHQIDIYHWAVPAHG